MSSPMPVESRGMEDVSFGDVWSVLKWVLLVLAAGFIGQFGRHAAQRLLERRRRARKARLSPEELALEREKALAKLEKKRIKAQLKVEKKGGKARAKEEKKRGKPKTAED